MHLLFLQKTCRLAHTHTRTHKSWSQILLKTKISR